MTVTGFITNQYIDVNVSVWNNRRQNVFVHLSELNYNINSLPKHEGAIIFLNIFKVDSWAFPNTTNNNRTINNTFNIFVTNNIDNVPVRTFTLSGTNDNGANICGGP